MIGLGKWACSVKSMFFSGDVKINIFDDGGKYGFELEVPGVQIPDITVVECKEDGNTINAITQTSLLPGKNLELTVTFDGDKFDGFLKIPFIGKIKFNDGHKVG